MDENNYTDLSDYELKYLDNDISDFFNADIKRRYIHSLPTLMQIERHLRVLVKDRTNS